MLENIRSIDKDDLTVPQAEHLILGKMLSADISFPEYEKLRVERNQSYYDAREILAKILSRGWIRGYFILLTDGENYTIKPSLWLTNWLPIAAEVKELSNNPYKDTYIWINATNLDDKTIIPKDSERCHGTLYFKRDELKYVLENDERYPYEDDCAEKIQDERRRPGRPASAKTIFYMYLEKFHKRNLLDDYQKEIDELFSDYRVEHPQGKEPQKASVRRYITKEMYQADVALLRLEKKRDK